MALQIVVEVYHYEADTPEEAAAAVRSIRNRYDAAEHVILGADPAPTFVYAASSLDDLPHPMQIGEIAEAMGS